jgi:hypothetical protein
LRHLGVVDEAFAGEMPASLREDLVFKLNGIGAAPFKHSHRPAAPGLAVH